MRYSTWSLTRARVPGRARCPSVAIALLLTSLLSGCGDDEMGPEQDDWMRLFLVPGMGHCRGGPGPNTFDSIAALERWREKGIAPSEMLGTNRESGLERPICAYPQYAKYDGSGDLKDRANFSCAEPE